MELAKFFQRFTRANPVKQLSWNICLQASSDALRDIAANTEDDFLQFGERLQDYYERAKGLSQMSSQVASRLSGDDMNQGIVALHAIFDIATRQNERSAQGVVTLESMLQKLADVESRLGSFDKTVKNLQVLCNFIKIESARLGQCDNRFDTLGDDVRQLAGTIASRSKDLSGQSSSLSLLIRQYLKKIADYETRQQGQARLILDSATRNLNALTGEYDLASGTLKTIAVRWESISKNIGEIVSSMQFHDITRQRLEHICDALVGVTSESPNEAECSSMPVHRPQRFFSGGRNGDRDGREARKASLIVSLCELQKAQLVNAEGDLTSAVDRLNQSLLKIADSVIMTAEEIRKIATTTSGDGHSFLHRLERDILSLIDAIAAYSALDRDLSTSMRTVNDAVGQMTSFIRDIQRIGIDLHMIALNAIVQAAHIGQKGATLVVLAESIHRLSIDTAHNIEAVSKDLSTVIDDARSSQGHGETGAGGFTEGMDSRIAAVLGPIRLIDTDVTTLIARIGEGGTTLAQDIEAAVRGDAIHKRMTESIHEVVAELTALIADIRSVHPVTAVQAAEDGFQNLVQRYTMDQERQVHQGMIPLVAVAGIPALLTLGSHEEAMPEDAPFPPEQVMASGESDGDLGDNVELF